MDIDEAKQICKKLTDINLAIWRSRGQEANALREQFRAKYRSVLNAGFKIVRYREFGNPMFRPRVNRHVEDVVTCSNRPDGFNIKNDCTTRCISLCTGVDYMTIRNEQLANARATHGVYTWKHDVVWQKSLMSRGFTKLVLRKHLSRATLIRLAKTSLAKNGVASPNGMIATVSSGHIAAIDMDKLKIFDTWNSSGGRIKTIFVPDSLKQSYMHWLQSIGYPAYVD